MFNAEYNMVLGINMEETGKNNIVICKISIFYEKEKQYVSRIYEQ